MNNIIKRMDNRPATFGSVVDQLFPSNLSRIFDDRFWGFNGLQAESRVPVNIGETDSCYEIELVAPGLKPEDLELTFKGDILTIAFEPKQQEADVEPKNWIVREHRSQSFRRSFTVDHTVDVDKATARYENGVILLRLPKKEESKRVARKIEVQ